MTPLALASLFPRSRYLSKAPTNCNLSIDLLDPFFFWVLGISYILFSFPATN